MPQDPHAKIDETVLDMIERSPNGTVPHTPTYQDALKRLHAAQKVYTDADHKDGHVTARTLAKLPVFHASNLESLIAGKISAEALEPNASIFSRYVKSLPAPLQAKAEALRLKVAGKPPMHRHNKDHSIHDPVHTLLLVPGSGPHPGIVGNYLYGTLLQLTASESGPWALDLHDSFDGVVLYDAPDMAGALQIFQDVIASAPFHLNELLDLGFRLK